MRDVLPHREYSEDPPREILERQYGAGPRVEIILMLVRIEPDRRRVLQIWVYRKDRGGMLVGQDENLRDMLEKRPKGDRAGGYYWAYLEDGVARISGIEGPAWT